MNTAAPYVLDAKALALVGATGRPLALDPSSVDRAFATLPVSRLEFGGGDGDYVDGDTAADESQHDCALVRIEGPLAQRAMWEDLCTYVDGYDAIASRFSDALNSARSVVLVIDSPGGDSAGLAEAVRRMRAMADDAGKPVVAFADEYAASAAYWIAAGVADEVYVPPLGSVGSVGCIAVHADMSGAAAKEGIALTIVRQPAGKAAGTSLEPLGEVGRARLEREVGAIAGAFIDAIAARRGLSAEAVRGTNADMFRGSAAVSAGFADGVATLEEVFTRAIELADERDDAMKLKQAMGQLVRAPETASDDEMVRGAQAAAPIMNLGRFAMSLAGTADPTEATKAVAAWKTAFDLEQAKAPKKAAKKAEKRLALLREAVVVGLVSGPKSLKVDPGGELVAGNIAPQWAEMDLGLLEDLVAQRRERSAIEGGDGARRPDPVTGVLGASTLSTEELEYSTRFAIDAKQLAAFKASGKAN